MHSYFPLQIFTALSVLLRKYIKNKQLLLEFLMIE